MAGVVAVAVAFSVAGHFAVIVVVLGALVLAWFVPLAGAIALAGGAPWAEVWAKAGALARAVAWTLAVAWAWAGAGVLTWAEAWAEYGAFFGTQLLMSTLVHLWAIAHPQNPHRWRSGVMIVLSVAGGIFCFNRALAEGDSIIVFAEGDPILPGVVLGASSLGIIALVVATLVGAGRGLRRSTGLGYWGRWAVMAVPIVLGAVLGWGIYGIVPWAEWLL